MIENRTEEQKQKQLSIDIILRKRPNVSVNFISNVLNLPVDEISILLDDLVERGVVNDRVSLNYLDEKEGDHIKAIHEEIAFRLGKDKISAIPLSELERMLESALIRKKELSTAAGITVKNNGAGSNMMYIDKLLMMDRGNKN